MLCPWAESNQGVGLVIINVSVRLGILVLVLSGKFELEDVAIFQSTLGENRPDKKVIVDLFHLDFLSLAGVSAIARLGMHNSNVAFLPPAIDQVKTKLETTGIINMLHFYDTVGEAFSALEVE